MVVGLEETGATVAGRHLVAVVARGLLQLAPPRRACGRLQPVRRCQPVAGKIQLLAKRGKRRVAEGVARGERALQIEDDATLLCIDQHRACGRTCACGQPARHGIEGGGIQIHRLQCAGGKACGNAVGFERRAGLRKMRGKRLAVSAR